MGLPINSLNQRTSAHYIEINKIYGGEMLKRVLFFYFSIPNSIKKSLKKETDYLKKKK